MAIGLRTGAGVGRGRAGTSRFMTRVQQQLTASRDREGRCLRCGGPIGITQDRVRQHGVVVHLQCAVGRGPDAGGAP